MIAFAALIDDQEDLQLFNHIVEAYQIEMFRVARSVLGDNQLAEDAVQNALYGIAVSFQRIPSADADELHAYVLSCAKYAAYRILRSERHEETSELTEIAGASSEDDPTFARIEQSEDYDQLLQAIKQLDETYQDVLLHYYVFEQSVKEIAKLFGRKPSTIRQQLTRARRQLAEICRKEGIVCG